MCFYAANFAFETDSNSIILSYNTDKGLTLEEIKKYNARIMPAGSILTGCVGRYGIAAIIDKDIVANQQLHCYVPMKELNPRYLAYMIKTQAKYFEDIAIKTTLKYVNKTKMEGMIVSLPPLSEQNIITNRIDRLLTLINDLELQVKDRKDKAEELMQAVLREAFERRVI